MVHPPTHPFIAAIDNREAPRTRLAIPARLRLAGSTAFGTTVHNLSLAGFNADAVGIMPPGGRCWLMIEGLESLQSEVVWQRDAFAGFSFYSALSPIVVDHLIARYPRQPLW